MQQVGGEPTAYENLPPFWRDLQLREMRITPNLSLVFDRPGTSAFYRNRIESGSAFTDFTAAKMNADFQALPPQSQALIEQIQWPRHGEITLFNPGKIAVALHNTDGDFLLSRVMGLPLEQAAELGQLQLTEGTITRLLANMIRGAVIPGFSRNQWRVYPAEIRTSLAMTPDGQIVFQQGGHFLHVVGDIVELVTPIEARASFMELADGVALDKIKGLADLARYDIPQETLGSVLTLKSLANKLNLSLGVFNIAIITGLSESIKISAQTKIYDGGRLGLLPSIELGLLPMVDPQTATVGCFTVEDVQFPQGKPDGVQVNVIPDLAEQNWKPYHPMTLLSGIHTNYGYQVTRACDVYHLYLVKSSEHNLLFCVFDDSRSDGQKSRHVPIVQVFDGDVTHIGDAPIYQKLDTDKDPRQFGEMHLDELDHIYTVVLGSGTIYQISLPREDAGTFFRPVLLHFSNPNIGPS